MWQRFTERARRIVFFAQEEAGQLGENSVSTEHLLLGLIREHDNFAARLLVGMGISLDALRDEVKSRVTMGEGGQATDMQLTPRVKRVIDHAFEESKSLANNYIGTEHILLGLLHEAEGVAAQVLTGMGIELEAARTVVREVQKSYEEGKDGDQSTSSVSGIKETLQRLRETFTGKAQEARSVSPAAPSEQGHSRPAPTRGDIGILKATPERPQIEFVMAEADLAEFADVMGIRDEYAYRDMVTAGKIVLLDAGMTAKYLRSGEHGCWYVRLLDGLRAGETGYVQRDTLQDTRPDDRPFPPQT